MTRLRYPVLRALYTLFLGVTMLCVTAMPMLASAHGLHELQHLLADAGAESADSGNDDGTDNGFDQLHVEDGCLHAQALVSVPMRWSLPLRRGSPPVFEALPPPASPSSSFLRPPIV